MNYSLSKIIKWLSENSITTVITLNRFGAIGNYKDGSDGIVIAWPLDVGKVVDPTGAGDAFASGMISTLKGKKHFSFNEFISAIEVGRSWASYACTSLGASTNCPDKKTIDIYMRKKSGYSRNRLIEVTKKSYAEQIVALIDKAY